jgi:hypothetical protein
MARKPKSNPSIPSEHIAHGKHFAADGRKMVELPHVGAMSPDADPDDTNRTREARRRRTARR